MLYKDIAYDITALQKLTLFRHAFLGIRLGGGTPGAKAISKSSQLLTNFQAAEDKNTLPAFKENYQPDLSPQEEAT